MFASVTVSIAAETIGVFNSIFLEKRLDNRTSRGKTSEYDGTPNVLGEALSHGIPVLAPKNVGLSNLILKNGSYGFLYKPDNSYSFKRKIAFITKNYNKSLNKASLGRLSLKRFNKENTLKKLNQIILKL